MDVSIMASRRVAICNRVFLSGLIVTSIVFVFFLLLFINIMVNYAIPFLGAITGLLASAMGAPGILCLGLFVFCAAALFGAALYGSLSSELTAFPFRIETIEAEEPQHTYRQGPHYPNLDYDVFWGNRHSPTFSEASQSSDNAPLSIEIPPRRSSPPKQSIVASTKPPTSRPGSVQLDPIVESDDDENEQLIEIKAEASECQPSPQVEEAKKLMELYVNNLIGSRRGSI
jgi:hypothetical protein